MEQIVEQDLELQAVIGFQGKVEDGLVLHPDNEHIIYPLAVRWFADGRLRLADQGAMLDNVLLPAAGHLLEI